MTSRVSAPLGAANVKGGGAAANEAPGEGKQGRGEEAKGLPPISLSLVAPKGAGGYVMSCYHAIVTLCFVVMMCCVTPLHYHRNPFHYHRNPSRYPPLPQEPVTLPHIPLTLPHLPPPLPHLPHPLPQAPLPLPHLPRSITTLAPSTTTPTPFITTPTPLHYHRRALVAHALVAQKPSRAARTSAEKAMLGKT